MSTDNPFVSIEEFYAQSNNNQPHPQLYQHLVLSPRETHEDISELLEFTTEIHHQLTKLENIMRQYGSIFSSNQLRELDNLVRSLNNARKSLLDPNYDLEPSSAGSLPSPTQPSMFSLEIGHHPNDDWYHVESSRTPEPYPGPTLIKPTPLRPTPPSPMSNPPTTD